MSNFSFFRPDFPALEKLGALAENYLYSDSNACLYKLGSLAETMVKHMFELDRIALPEDDTPANRIRILKREGMLPRHIGDLLYALRTKRNVAVHEGYDSLEDARTLLEMAYSLSVWFMRTYGDHNFKPQPFVPPPNRRADEEIARLQQENEALATELEKARAVALSATLDTAVTASERKQRSDKAIHDLKLSEKETRYLIDEQLCRAGWEANSETLRHARGARPQKGRNLAIAEWPTCFNGREGFADYALFAELRLVGVVEAKARHVDIPAVVDNQCREYSQGIRAEDKNYVIADWNGYQAPFLFAANGRPYLKQLETNRAFGSATHGTPPISPRPCKAGSARADCSTGSTETSPPPARRRSKRLTTCSVIQTASTCAPIRSRLSKRRKRRLPPVDKPRCSPWPLAPARRVPSLA